MKLHDLIHAMLEGDALSVRQWLIDANRTDFDWASVVEPAGYEAVEAALAAGVVEVMCARTNADVPFWTSKFGPVTEEVFLVQHARRMPRLLETCRLYGPEPLRKRNFIAPPEYLRVA